jgi:hypothetical protein
VIDYVVRPISDRTAFAGRHRPTPFASSWSATEALLDRELRQLKARDVVLELDFLEGQIRIDGRPRATARAATPATRLAFESIHGPLTYATDVFPTWQDNVRAIALGLEALRKVDRYGVVRRGEQYQGFKQLGSGTTALPSSHMTSDEAYAVLERIAVGEEGETRVRYLHTLRTDPDELRRCFREARRASHPDHRDGDRSAWDQVEEAAKVLGVIA